MNGVSLLLAIASLGVVYTWRTGVDQQQEYVLQIEPEIVQALLAPVGPSGRPEEIDSDVPPEAGSCQRICISILPKDSPAAKHTIAGEERFRQLLAAGGRLASSDRTLLATDVPATILWSGRPNALPEQTYGVTTGWQPDAVGNVQYLVQIDPAVLSTLSVGDELYVPVEPAAGRITKFIVKAGKEKLPRMSGQTQFTQSLQPTPPLNGAGRNAWGNAPASDPSRLPRWNGGYGEVPTADSRTSQFQSPPNPPLVPRSVGFEPAPPVAGDGFGRSYEQYRSPPASDLANYPAFNPPAANQQPQFPGSRPFGSGYPDARTAAVPPAPTSFGPIGPGATNSNMMQPNQDRPWGPLLFVTFALFFSIGGNLYLAYTALEFHSRYRNAIERLRSAARST